MADGKFHRRVGVGIGGVTAWAMAGGQPFALRVVETVGGMIGGGVGALMPDVLNPPTSPRHRSWAHGILPVGTAAFWSLANLKGWQRRLRHYAAQLRAALAVEQDGLRRFLLGLAALAVAAAAGALAGFIAGYISHLALDAVTPAFLPWIA